MKARKAKQRRAPRAAGAAALARRLREVEKRYELVMGAINEAVYDWDLVRGRFTTSESMQRVLGLPAGRLSLEAWRKAVHPEDYARFREATIAHLKGRTARFDCEYRFRAADGSWRWARTHGLATRDRSGRAVRMIGSTGDVTELKARERELAEQQAILETTLENIDQGITMVDAELRTIALNRRFLELLGFPPERFARGFHMEEAFRFNAERGEYGPGDVEEQVRSRLELTRRFEPHAFERARPNGQVIAVRGKPIPGGGFVSTYTDVTEQRRAQDGLRASEERYALATAAAAEGIYEWDLRSGALFLTDRAKGFFGLEGEHLTPAAWNVRVHAEDFPAYRAALIEHFKGRSDHLEHEYRIADGRGGYRWVLDRGLALRDAAGRAVKLVGALSDVTRRKQAELELRRARDEAEAALAEQTAIAEVLRAMSGSHTDAAPVFDAIVRHAVRLCGGQFGAAFRYDGELQHVVALHNFSPEAEQMLRAKYPAPPREDQSSGRAILARTVQRVEDTQTLGPTAELSQAGGWNRILSVPILRHGAALGAISVAWREAGPIPRRQVELLRTFAEQAAIAVENVRLFNETREALERQTAISDVLRLIAGSPGDVMPMLEAVARHAVKLCESAEAAIFLREGDGLRFVAGCQTGSTFAPGETMPLSRGSVIGRAVIERAPVRVADLAAAPAEEFPLGREYQRRFGHRSILAVPLLREERAIGAIVLWRYEVRDFSDQHVVLVRTFADQAAIAIENVRLFNETREALERQQALAGVLSAISSSIADTAPVFGRILESCERLFAGQIVGLNLVGEDGMLHIGAFQGAHRAEFERIYPLPVTPESGSGLSIVERRVVHYPDAQQGAEVPARTRQGCSAIGVRSVLFAPLLSEGRGIGAIFVGRERAGPFSGKDIALLQTFADQAAIAIENARLFREIQDKSRQLEVASRHKSEFLANMSHELRTPLNAIIGFARIVMRRSKEALEPKQYENLEKILASAQHLLALINAVLDLSKVEAGRVEVVPAEVDLAPVLEGCLRTVEPLVRGEVALVREFGAGLPPMYVDEEKLRQVLINLLSNAAKFTERGAIRLAAQAANGAVQIAVADTGIGIPADKLELIFEEFEQVDASSTRAHGGTGLGLAIARRLARLMGGDVRAASTPGAGSTFTLTLPLRYRA